MIISFTVGCSWSKKHQVMFGLFTVLNTVDTLQTRKIKTSPEYEELNPGLRGMTVDQATLVKIGYNGAVYLAAEAYPAYRDWIIGVPLLFGAICVIRNFQLKVPIE